MTNLKNGDRVRDTETGIKGRFLRYEKYPGSKVTWATVKWDWAMAARRIEPGRLEKVLVN